MATIILASKDGNNQAVKELLAKGADLDDVDKKGRTCLDLALDKKHYETVKLLLDGGADINKNDWALRAIKTLVKKGKKRAKVIEAIAEAGFDINTDVGKGENILLFAIKNGFLEIIPTLLKLGSDVKVRDRYGDQPIHIAASRGFAEVTKALLQYRAYPDSFNGQGQRPIHLACYNGHTDVCRELVRRRADLNAKTKLHADTPLKIAFSHVCNDMVKVLIKNGVDLRDDPSCDFSPLLTAVNTQNLDLVNLCIDHGAPISRKALERALKEGFTSIFRALFESEQYKNSANDFGNDLLMLALQYGWFEIAKVLLENGVKVDEQALVESVNNDQIELVKMFLDHGKDNEARLDALLTIAIRRQNVEICSILLSHGADGNYSHEGQPCLHHAISTGKTALVKLLMEYGAEVGAEAFKMAVDSDQNELVKIFLEHGDSVDGPQGKGHLADLNELLARAVGRKNAEIAKMLLESGADPSATDAEGNPLLHSAIDGGRSDLVKLLLDHGAKVDLECLRKAIGGASDEMVEMLLDKAGDEHEEALDQLLDMAVRQSKSKIAGMLLKRGADGTRCSVGGTSVLGLAIDSGRLDLVKMLLEHGADITLDALKQAVDKNHTDLVKTFLEAGKRRGEELDDLLPIAIRNQNTDIVNILLKHGADPNQIDDDGNPMLHMAADTGRLDLVLILLQNGALVHSKDKNGRTAIDIAKEMGHDNIVNTLLKHAVELSSDSFYKKHNARAYPMCGKRRGSVLIFHIQYHTGTQHRRSSISHATMPNVEDLKILFAQLCFRIDEVTDVHMLSARGMKNRVQQFAESITEDDQCVVVLVMGRVGANNTIVANDGMPVNIDEAFIQTFNKDKCPQFKGKPKLFLFESAKGRCESTRTPKHSDVVIGFSTQMGPIAYRDTSASSYMETVVQVFRELACEMHFTDLLTEVQRRLIEDNNNNGSSPTVSFASSLTRPLYLFPGIVED